MLILFGPCWARILYFSPGLVIRKSLVRRRRKLARYCLARTFAGCVARRVEAHPHESLLRSAYCGHWCILTGFVFQPSTIVFAIVRMVVTDAVVVTVLALHPCLHRLWQASEAGWLALQIGDVLKLCHWRRKLAEFPGFE